MNKSSLLSKSLASHLGSFLYKIFRYVLLLGVSYIALFPLIKMASTALSLAEDNFNGVSGYIPENPTFENFINSQQYFDFFRHAKVTVLISVTSTIVSVFVCSLIGYGLGRYKFKGSNLVYAAVLFTVIMPIQTAQIPLVYYYRWFDFFGIGQIVGLFTGEPLTVNLLTNLGCFLVPAVCGVGLKAGIFIFLFRQFFAGMPRDLEEAAKLDGCSPFKIYWKVMLPNIIPVLVTVILLSMIYYWNDALVSSMVSLKDTPLMVEIEKLSNGNIGVDQLTIIRRAVEYNAILLMSILPLVAVFVVCQKFFVECMDRSGSKG